MKERPILFKGEMVRAILAGTKTQTRRAMNPQPVPWGTFGGWSLPKSCYGSEDCFRESAPIFETRFGRPGDRLWVRETFVQGWALSADGCVDQFDEAGNERPMKTFYRATSPDLNWYDGGDDCKIKTPWKPSIHMPRWASRITLEITEVRVERLQDISRGDAMAEGCPFPNMADGDNPRHWYADLWNSINRNTPGSWDANPWVWCVSFRRIEQ